MRNAFINTLVSEAKNNKDILLLTGDLGFTVIEKFKEKYPSRFFNLGVAEANMLGVAAGLALSGKIPVVYSIAPFVTLRPYEQIRNDICMHNANVKIVGVGGGLSYSHAGPTHHITEDFAVMRVLPNMTIICPCDPQEVKQAVKAMITYKGPVYLRLGKVNEPIILPNKSPFIIGKGKFIKTGKKLFLISSGPIIKDVLKCADLLEKKSLSTAVINFSTIKPLDLQLLNQIIKTAEAIITIEEHNIIGGLGSAVSEYLAENKVSSFLFKRIGISDRFCWEIGDYNFHRELNSLSATKLFQTIYKIVKNRKYD